jgi:hypothetical protein
MIASSGFDARKLYWSLSLVLLLAGCANLTVTHITPDNQATVQGVRYYLPKPFLQVVPKADGTVAVTVIYLPDTKREYAVDTTSQLSSYTFQIARDPLGLLSGVEYKADTTAIGQQLAASAQAAAVQSYNLNASQLASIQTQVNTAQSAVDTAVSALAAAQAALSSDTANLPAAASTTPSQLATDNSNVQQAIAKLQAAQQVLARTQAASQYVPNTISASTPVTTSGPTMGTALVAPALTPTLYNLPSKFGVVLYAVNEDANGVSLKAVTTEIPGTGLGSVDELHAGVNASAQRTFDTVGTALGAPSLSPAVQSVKLTDQQAVFTFSRAITSLSSDGFTVQTDTTPPVSATIPSSPNPLQADHMTLKLDIRQLTAGSTYVINMKYIWPVDSDHAHDQTTIAQVKLTVTK